MNRQSDCAEPGNRSPLLPIGIIVLSMLALPALLSSTVPDGPVKDGDVVFSTDQHRVYFVHPERFEALGYADFCLLQPREQLLIMRTLAAREPTMFIARTIRQPSPAFPFCPSQADLMVKSHQITLKATVWGGLSDLLAHVFSS
ncbi:MAG: hypothetical protein D6690_12765 [Nitrospirae bacterium]|nr:MAG: hypothetical protein D6690_12765 [Nitrospirota bacterium]